MIELDTTVKGGLPVIAQVVFSTPSPSVGLLHGEADVTIFWRGGKIVTKKVYDSIPEADFDRIIEEAGE